MFSIVPFAGNSHLIRRRGNYLLNSLFDDFFKDDFFPVYGDVNLPIKADIQETDNEFIIEAEMPGLKREDINLKLKDNTITISVEKKEEKEEQKDNYIRKERRCGSYRRSFYIEDINTADINAKYEKGILTVTLPKEKVEKVESKNIEIH